MKTLSVTAVYLALAMSLLAAPETKPAPARTASSTQPKGSAPAKPGTKDKAQSAGANASLADWWNAELDSMKGADSTFYSGKVVVQKGTIDEQLFTLAEIKGAIYGAKGSGTVIYSGSAWTVGEYKDISGHKVLFEELIRPSDTQPGKARFTIGTASREVMVDDPTSSSTIKLLNSPGWITGDGAVIAVPVGLQKIGGRAWVEIDGIRHPAKVTQLEGSWTYLTLSRESTLIAPSIAAPREDEKVTLATIDGRSFTAPYRVLAVKEAIPENFAGAAVISSDGALVGFIGNEEGFVPAPASDTVNGEGKFNPAERLVKCSIEH